MKKVQISLNSIDKVKSFVNELSKFDFDFDLVSGRYVIDAKSIMGIFSLDLAKPIDLNIHAEGEAQERSAKASRFAKPFSFALFQDTVITSALSTAVCSISPIFSCSFTSERLITFRLGFVTGCFATKMVQQSS